MPIYTESAMSYRNADRPLVHLGIVGHYPLGEPLYFLFAKICGIDYSIVAITQVIKLQTV